MIVLNFKLQLSMFKEFVVIFAIFFLLLNTISSQPLTVENSVQTEVYKIANDKVMKNGRIGVCVKSLQTGKTILSENALKNMAPASNLKLMTTAAALGVLGETYTFKTYIEYDGEIKDSVLYGNLYIRGTGDPTLGSDRFKGFWSKKNRRCYCR
jgi:D-alanyl-D-alanine carboxypeptidase/D-alanyl-D-alanine-endopeptidase (penicillin-binding protein 4)